MKMNGIKWPENFSGFFVINKNKNSSIKYTGNKIKYEIQI